LTATSPAHGYNEDFQQSYSQDLTGYYDVIDQIRTLLGGLSADKGQAYYNRASQVQTVVKNHVNAAKDVFTGLNDFTASDPVLSPLEPRESYPHLHFVD
jgi:hypothetical protein